MNTISNIGTLLKKIYRGYSSRLLHLLQERGYTDLRPSFLEVLLYISDHDGPSIKAIGEGCGLKKQTMTSHLNELTKRGYIERKINPHDKREQNIFLTDYGRKFKLTLSESVSIVEEQYTDLVGEVELSRVEHLLSNFNAKIDSKDKDLSHQQLSLV